MLFEYRLNSNKRHTRTTTNAKCEFLRAQNIGCNAVVSLTRYITPQDITSKKTVASVSQSFLVFRGLVHPGFANSRGCPQNRNTSLGPFNVQNNQNRQLEQVLPRFPTTVFIKKKCLVGRGRAIIRGFSRFARVLGPNHREKRGMTVITFFSYCYHPHVSLCEELKTL